MHKNPGATPTTFQGDLAKLPRALTPLIERPQWAVWRWTREANGRWQKPPFQALDPRRHASTKNPSTWSDYATALAVVQAGDADGITYMLAPDDPFAAIDLDHCRDPDTRSFDKWVMNFLDVFKHTYLEATPSGAGCRIWGLTADNTEPINRKFSLEIDGKPVAAELFRRTPKALTVTGLRLSSVKELANVDRGFGWGIIWGERRKAQAAEAAAKTELNGHSFNSGGVGYDIEYIEQIVCEGAPAGRNRSDCFHAVIGHYLGCGWNVEQICEHLQQFPHGIGGRYLAEGRLSREISRSAGKYNARALPLFDGWTTKTPQLVKEDPELEEIEPEPTPDTELVEIVLPEPASNPEQKDNLSKPTPDDSELEETPPDSAGLIPDPELEDVEDLEDDEELDEEPRQDPQLPLLHAHGDEDPRPLKAWLIKRLFPAVGHGLLSGQWGAGKTFVAFDLAASLATGQPFLDHPVKRQCGVLLIAAEGADEVRLRLDAVIRTKCGGVERAPFRWYETAPLLLQNGSAETLIAMARQADDSLQQEFGLPLGLIIIDTIAACAGYARAGDENDPAAAQAVMNVLKVTAQALGCFVLGVDHFGKNQEAGTRGASSKEGASDLVLACLGDKSISGSVTNTRLAVRKNRGGQQGREYPFTLRAVEALQPDEDGEPITTMVVDWRPPTPGGNRPEPDPWAESRRQDQRTAVLRLKRVLMEILADQGVDLPIPPDGPTVRMVDKDLVQERFYSRTPVEGTPKQKRQLRFLQFKRALGWAEDQQLIGIEEIDGVTYLRLTRPDREEDEQC